MFYANADIQINGKPRVAGMPVPEASEWSPYVVEQHKQRGLIVWLDEKSANEFAKDKYKNIVERQVANLQRRAHKAHAKFLRRKADADRARTQINVELTEEKSAWDNYQKALADFDQYVTESGLKIDAIDVLLPDKSSQEQVDLSALSRSELIKLASKRGVESPGKKSTGALIEVLSR